MFDSHGNRLLIVYVNVIIINMACANRDCEQKDPLLGYLRIQKLLWKLGLEVDHYKSLVFEALALQRIVLVQWIKFITVTYTPPAKSINTMQEFEFELSSGIIASK